jgi:hypothetical protein
MSRERPVVPVTSSVETLRRQMGLGKGSSRRTIGEVFPRLAGPDLADRCRVVELRDGVVTVDAFDPAAAEVLGWSKARILAGLRESCPGERITSMNVRVRRREAPGSADRTPGLW